MDEQVKRRVLRLITYGLYILTARHGEEMAAGTINWLSQASFQPPLVMLGVKRDSKLHELIEKSGKLAVNVLGAGQKDIAEAFFKPSKIEGDKINGYRFEPAPNSGAPLLLDLPAWFEAEVVEAVKKGDHTVFIAKVVEVGLRDPEAKPLVMWDTGWFYGG